MTLPEHLDYEETSDGEDWWPEVRCTIAGCKWRYDATWDELGDDGDTDWNVVHRAHQGQP